MRRAVLAVSLVLIAAACERGGVEEPPPPAPSFTAPVSDELPGLAATATGIAFWEHPTLSFNSMMIVANADGAVAYNIEDGAEAARIDGVDAQGAAVAYLGVGAQAAGALALFDRDASAFRFYGIDNISRAFLPLEGGPAVEGGVKDFCFGRAQGVASPTLFAIRTDEILIFDVEAAGDGVALAAQGALAAPGGLASCAVDIDGVLLVASENGAIYRIAGPDSFEAPFAKAPASVAGDIAVIAAETGGEEASSVSGQVLLLDRANGALHVFDRADGRALGVLRASGTDMLEGVDAAEAVGATGANFGALYRNGVVAYGVAGDTTMDGAPAVRLLPVNALMNALSLPEGEAISPRGRAAVAEDDALTIRTRFERE